MSAWDELIDFLAALMYENEQFPNDWHRAGPEDVAEYRRIAAEKVNACAHELSEKIRTTYADLKTGDVTGNSL